MPNRASILTQQFLQSVASPWEKLLPDALVQELLAKEKITYYQSIYTPVVTLWAMVSQALDPDKSLSQAVKRMSTWLSAAGAKPPSSDTGAYSKARIATTRTTCSTVSTHSRRGLRKRREHRKTMVWTTSASIRWDNSIDE